MKRFILLLTIYACPFWGSLFTALQAQYPFRTYLTWDSTAILRPGNGVIEMELRLPNGTGAMYDAQRIYRDSTVWRTQNTTRLTLRADGTLSGAFVTGSGSVLSGDFLVDGSVLAEKMTAQAQSFNLNLSFTPSDHNTVTWNSGNIILANLNFTALNSGTTGDMSGLTYIYFNGTSTLQVTTDYATAIGENVLLLAVCKPAGNSSQQAFVVPAIGVAFLNEENLSANSISANKLQANSVTASKINVSSLSAISADMGSITAGQVVVGSSNKLWLNDAADGALQIGGSVKANAPFQVTAAGALTATGATISGVFSTGGSDGITIDNLGIEGGTITFEGGLGDIKIIKDGLAMQLIFSGAFDYVFDDAKIYVTGDADIGGTITSATWGGNVIGTSVGGTGLSGFTTANRLIYSTSSSALATLAAAGSASALTMDSGAPTWTAGWSGSINFSTDAGDYQITVSRGIITNFVFTPA